MLQQRGGSFYCIWGRGGFKQVYLLFTILRQPSYRECLKTCFSFLLLLPSDALALPHMLMLGAAQLEGKDCSPCISKKKFTTSKIFLEQYLRIPENVSKSQHFIILFFPD